LLSLLFTQAIYQELIFPLPLVVLIVFGIIVVVVDTHFMPLVVEVIAVVDANFIGLVAQVVVLRKVFIITVEP